VDLVGYGWAQFYKALPTPHVRITQLRPTSAALFEGETFRATCAWWNAYLDKRPALHRRGSVTPFADHDVQRLNAAVNPENGALFEEMGAEHAPTAPHLGAAALTLSYAFARTLYCGNPW
jgi:hypothetical protein